MGWAEALSGSRAVVPTTGSTWSGKQQWTRTCCAPPDLHRHSDSFSGNRVTWKPWNWGAQHECKSTSPSTGVQGSLEMKKKVLMYFKSGCHSKSLGFLFTSLSSLILQPAKKGKQVPWNKTCQQQLYKKNNQTNMWIWLSRFLPQFYKSSPLPTILTHNIQ